MLAKDPDTTKVLKSLYYEHNLHVFDNHDGDSVYSIIELVNGLYGMDLCRLLGLNTKELSDKTVVGRQIAREARSWLSGWLIYHHHGKSRTFERPFTWAFRARFIEAANRDKYGRYLLYVVCATCGEVLNDALLAARSTHPDTIGIPLAEPYMKDEHEHVKWARWVHENQIRGVSMQSYLHELGEV